MLQLMALERWSQVTIYAKPSRCSIGLPHEGANRICKTLQRWLANTPNRHRQAEFMQMFWKTSSGGTSAAYGFSLKCFVGWPRVAQSWHKSGTKFGLHWRRDEGRALQDQFTALRDD